MTFDPTPPAGRAATTRTGFAGMLSKYSEALELMWFQYVVGYDKQEQRSLVTSARNKLFDLQRGSVNKFAQAARFPGSLADSSERHRFRINGPPSVTRRVRRCWRRGLKVGGAETIRRKPREFLNLLRLGKAGHQRAVRTLGSLPSRRRARAETYDGTIEYVWRREVVRRNNFRLRDCVAN